MTLVPVGVEAPDAGELQRKLNAIYAPYGVEFTVKVDGVIKDLEGWKGRTFKLEGNGFFTRENADMAEVRKAYQAVQSTPKGSYYVFVLGRADASSEDGATQANGAQGDMPRGQQFGYVFGDGVQDWSWLLAHELGHGVFTLQHLEDGNYGAKGTLGSIANLMNYTRSTELQAFQWNIMSNPAILTALDSDDASKAKLNLKGWYSVFDQQDNKIKYRFLTEPPTEEQRKNMGYLVCVGSVFYDGVKYYTFDGKIIECQNKFQFVQLMTSDFDRMSYQEVVNSMLTAETLLLKSEWEEGMPTVIDLVVRRYVIPANSTKYVNVNEEKLMSDFIDYLTATNTYSRYHPLFTPRLTGDIAAGFEWLVQFAYAPPTPPFVLSLPETNYKTIVNTNRSNDNLKIKYYKESNIIK